MTADGSHIYYYDAEGRISQVDGTLGNCSTATACYVYDADGRRARRILGSATWDFLYDLAGHEITAFAGSSWNRGEVYAGGRHLATYVNGTTYFIHGDWLGTERARSTSTGSSYETCTSLPFGDALTCSTTDVSPMHFTGKERDAESGLDNFGARSNSSQMGRFMTPDWTAKIEPVPYSKRDEPNTLNLYTYVLDNPLSSVDSDGHACSELLGNTSSGFCQRAVEYGKMDSDQAVRGQTRFFAAASAVSQALADVAAWPVFSRPFASKDTANFLESLGRDLEKMNKAELAAIQKGSLGGPNLDARMVHMEQTEVQAQLDKLQQSNPTVYDKTIKEINGLLNPKSDGQLLASSIFTTDAAFGRILDQVRSQLGRDIDFSNQSDREAIGNAVIENLRNDPNCDVVGTTVLGCGP